MISALLGVGEHVVPTALMLLALAVAGLGLRACLRRWVILPPDFAITVGLGWAVFGTVLFAVHLAGGVAGDAVVPLLLVSVAVVCVACALSRRAGRSSHQSAEVSVYAWLGRPTKFDLWAAVTALVLLGPLLRFGLTSWTTNIYDFPNYVASAQIWADHGSGFLQQHPDTFGAWQLWRAGFEKPTMTALMVAAEKVTGIEVYLLLGPLSLVVVFVLFGSIWRTVASAFGIQGALLASLVLMTTASALPMQRVYEAQIGQVAAVALLAVFLSVLATTSLPMSRVGVLAVGLTWALLITSALSTNFTLLVGIIPTVVVAALWMLSSRPEGLRAYRVPLAYTTIFAVTLLWPARDWLITSYRIQSSGVGTGPVPLATPFALIGQQWSVMSGPTLPLTLTFWLGTALLCGALLALAKGLGRVRIGWPVCLLVAAGVNVGWIAIRLGVNNYATHKWITVFIALIMPLLLGWAFSILPATAQARAAMIAVPLAVLAVAMSGVNAVRTKAIIPKTLLALSHDPRLAQLPAVNVSLGDSHQKYLAPLLLPTSVVISVQQTFAPGGTPVGNTYLVATNQISPNEKDSAVALNDDYALVQRSLKLLPGTIEFTSAQPENAGHLYGNWHAPESGGTHHANSPKGVWYGSWYDPEPGGTWSSGTTARIAFDVGADLRRNGFWLTLNGSRFTPAYESRELIVSVNGSQLGRHAFTENKEESIGVWVPPDLIRVDGGRIVVELGTPDPVDASSPHGTPARQLSYFLHSLQISTSGPRENK